MKFSIGETSNNHLIYRAYINCRMLINKPHRSQCLINRISIPVPLDYYKIVMVSF